VGCVPFVSALVVRSAGGRLDAVAKTGRTGAARAYMMGINAWCEIGAGIVGLCSDGTWVPL
jgi:hypothetical protein